jgi:hypothetical protein
MAEGLLVESVVLGGKDTHRGEHRTEVTEVTEGGLRIGGRKAFVESAVSGRERHASGREHRTEVTEVTEGIEDWMAEGLLVESVVSGRERHASGRV